VPTKWRGYLDEARKTGNAISYQHFWELCVLVGLLDGLRTGDVFANSRNTSTEPPWPEPESSGRAVLLSGRHAEHHRTCVRGDLSLAKPTLEMG
jgi:hypothetical protein